MSGPVRLNFATLAANVPCPNSTMTTVSSSPAFAATVAERLRHAVFRRRGVGAAASRSPSATLNLPVAVSASVVPHFLNSSPCSGVPASPTTIDQMRATARTPAPRSASSERREQPSPDPRPSHLEPAPHASLQYRRRPHSAQIDQRRAPSAAPACATARALRPPSRRGPNTSNRRPASTIASAV